MFVRVIMSQDHDKTQTRDETRREFLRKSVYAAYATPVITALLVSQVSAAVSITSNRGQCQKAGGSWIPGNGDMCCDVDNDGSCG